MPTWWGPGLPALAGHTGTNQPARGPVAGLACDQWPCMTLCLLSPRTLGSRPCLHGKPHAGSCQGRCPGERVHVGSRGVHGPPVLVRHLLMATGQKGLFPHVPPARISSSQSSHRSLQAFQDPTWARTVRAPPCPVLIRCSADDPQIQGLCGG